MARPWRVVRLVFLALLLPPALFVAWLGFVWPPPSWWRTHWPRATAFQQMRERQYAAARDTIPLRYQPVPLDSIADWVERAATAAEDDAFFDHGGLDYSALRDALGYRRARFEWNDARDRAELRRVVGLAWVRRDRLRGASTITQQLAKNLYLSPSRNPLRKVKEAVIAWRLEWALSKERILELYLNVAEFGPNLWGAEAASRAYFGRGASRLSMEQAALLVATLPHPLTSNPGHRPGRTRYRASLILARLRGADVELPEEEGLEAESVTGGRDTMGRDTMRRDTMRRDTLRRDTVLRDSLLPDSLLPDSLLPDTLHRDTLLRLTLLRLTP